MARFRLARKTFGIAGALVGAKNWKAASTGIKTLANGTTKTLGTGGRIWEGSKGLLKSGATLGTAGTLAAGGTLAYKGGSNFMDGGEKSANEMEFS